MKAVDIVLGLSLSIHHQRRVPSESSAAVLCSRKLPVCPFELTGNFGLFEAGDD